MVVIDAGIAKDWQDATYLPADVAVLLLDQRCLDDGQEPEQTKTQVMADGSTHVSFSDVSDLTASLAATTWGGAKVGQ